MNMEYVYVIMGDRNESRNKAEHLAQGKPLQWVYGIYTTMAGAVAEVNDIYKNQHLGVKYGTEYTIKKTRVSKHHQ
tara:strand:+ start:198 stop:425 length:228 start_codon:yes stop_codon:yes gene_type:complete